MRRIPGFVRLLSTALLFIVVVLCLTLAIVPHFLDATYYRGPVSGHFDGRRFANPDGDSDTLAPPRGGSPGSFILRYLTGSDGRPPWPNHVAIVARPIASRVAGDAMSATWIGHATVLVQTQGLNILTDPIWSDTAGPLGIGPKRVAEPGIAFDRLPKIDLVLVSHDHYDHLDLATLEKLWARDKPMIVTSLGNDSVIRQAGAPSRALDWGERVMLRPGSGRPGIEVIVTRNHHWGSRWFSDRNRTLWSSFVVRLPGGNLFFAGDTGAGDLRWADEAAAYGPIRLALVPIGAFRFAAGQMGAGSHIGPIGALEVYRRLGAARGIGVHWGTFRLSYEAYDTPPRMLRALAQCEGAGAGFGTVVLGQPTAIPAYRPPSAAMPSAALRERCEGSAAVQRLR